MSLFENGRAFSLAIRCCPPPSERVPMVAVEMSSGPAEFTPVVGKVDTGAFCTMLSFETATELGMVDPTTNALGKRQAQSATGHPILYYLHCVWVRISDPDGVAIEFPLDAAFTGDVKRNLFGVDWLTHLCMAVDRHAVHFLKD